MNALKAFGLAISAGLVGYGIGVIHAQKVADAARRERIQQIKETAEKHRKKDDIESQDEKLDVKLTDGSIFPKTLDEKDYENYGDIVDPYTGPKGYVGKPDGPRDLDSEKKWDKSEDFDKISVEFPDDWEPEEEDPEEQEILQAALENMTLETREPHSISPEEFEQEELRYEQVTWTYFPHDGVILDFWNNLVEDDDTYIGDAKEYLKNAEDDFIMYWRAPEHKMEIELVVDRRPMADVYPGQREAARLEAIKERRGNGKDA